MDVEELGFKIRIYAHLLDKDICEGHSRFESLKGELKKAITLWHNKCSKADKTIDWARKTLDIHDKKFSAK